jgi:hypothetical protein
MISQWSRRKWDSNARLSALPELSRTMTWIFGLAHEHACAILDMAIGPDRFVGSNIESCTALLPAIGKVCGSSDADSQHSNKALMPLRTILNSGQEMPTVANRITADSLPRRRIGLSRKAQSSARDDENQHMYSLL